MLQTRLLLGVLLVKLACVDAYHHVRIAHGGDHSAKISTRHRRTRIPTCLSKQEVIEKLNQVPVFGLSNSEEQLMAAPDPETGTPAITFYVDVMEAQAKLAAVQAVNPGAELQLSVAPLGTAFAMSSQSQEDMVVRLQPSQAVMNGVRESLGFPAADASGAQPVPLFGSDELNFELPPGPECPEGGEMTPLFFAVDDFRAAWVASGQPADKLPALQLTDLRTLAYNMEHDSTKDWSPVLLIAPEAAIDFVKGGATASPPKAKEEEEAPELSGADVQSLLFGDDSDNPFGNKKTIRF